MTSKKNTQILILTQYYPPETGAPQNRLSDLAMRFYKAGFNVKVLTAKPNYPLGKVYPGFEKGFLQENLENGVHVLRCWIYASNKSLFHRLLNYFSFVFSALIIGLIKINKINLIIVESPPLFLSFVGWVLARKNGAKLLLNISDLYPETAISLGILTNKVLIKAFYCYEDWSYRISDLITCQTNGILSSIEKRFSKKQCYLFTNGMSFETLDQQTTNLENDHKKHKEFIIGYAGIIGYGQNLQVLIHVAKDLINYPSIVFHLYGDGPLKNDLILKQSQNSLTNIVFKGHLPHLDMLKIMRQWSLGLVSLADKPLMAGAIPSKMLEMMAIKLPILLIAPKGEAANIIEKSNGGIWNTPDLVKKSTESIIILFNNPEMLTTFGQNGYTYIKKNFNRAIIFQNFLDYLYASEIL